MAEDSDQFDTLCQLTPRVSAAIAGDRFEAGHALSALPAGPRC